ncbi:hypothetical protein [Zophobihabitans entericus]|uniref:Uncharacterized protein n=1 Tax=Zophobihabitans entericus TaxID=1635327 RepID=A0A6G9IBV3_9GAMM|nr:hypothetical protein [Zophobihabitans entericus]QIQ21060.1 hypothetical protein IPMB12_04805 [Zophobihabitans entericus]
MRVIQSSLKAKKGFLAHPILLGICLLYTNSTYTNAYAAISAVSAKTIQGNKPQFSDNEVVVRDISSRRALTLNGKTYMEYDGTYNGAIRLLTAEERALDLSVLENAVIAARFFLPANFADFDVTASYLDSDGDLPILNGTNLPFEANQTYTYNLIDTADGHSIRGNSGSLGKCSNFGMDSTSSNYTVLPVVTTIRWGNLIYPITTYGDPRKGDSVSLTTEYYLDTRGICSINTNFRTSQDVTTPFAFQKSGRYYTVINRNQAYPASIAPDPVYGGGYLADFHPTNGIDTSKAFPTIGFPGASFYISTMKPSINTPTANVYTYEALEGGSPSSNVTLSEEGGMLKVTLKSKPTGEVTIRLKGVITTPSIQEEYKFTINKWYTIHGSNTARMTYEQAVAACGTENNIATRAEITNAPTNTLPALDGIGYDNGTVDIPDYYDSSAFTRTIDDSIMGQWGAITGYNSLGPTHMWTAEPSFYNDSFGGVHFIVDAKQGAVIFDGLLDPNYARTGYGVICKG